MSEAIILSHFQVQPLSTDWNSGKTRSSCSPDLGLSSLEVELCPQGVVFPDGARLSWQAADEISLHENNCFALHQGELEKIIAFSELYDRVYSLYPTTGAPTLLVSGIPMHRIKGTDPHQDTLEKIRSIRPISGEVLDTATGLGYTAIESAKSARRVITIELDPAVIQLARLNPWSRPLFDNPAICQQIGDSFEMVKTYGAGSFNCIIHDPPAFALAGELYSSEFYRELYRVLRPGGRLFHYVGNPDSKSGRVFTAGVIRRLQSVGFVRITRCPGAFGVTALKSTADARR